MKDGDCDKGFPYAEPRCEEWEDDGLNDEGDSTVEGRNHSD